MPWYILAIINVTFLTSYGLTQRWALRDQKYNPNSYAIAMFFAASFSALTIATLSGSLDLNYASLPLGILSITFFFNTTQMPIISRALSYAEASVFSILTSLRIIPIMIGAAIFLGDEITPQIVAGAIVIIFATALLLYEKGMKIRLGKGELYSLLAGLVIAIPFISDTYILEDGYNAPSYLALVFFVPACILLLIRPGDRKDLKKYVKDKEFLYKALVPGASIAIAVSSILAAFQQDGSPTVLTIIAQLSSVTTVLFAIIFLKERDALVRKIIASFIAFGGLLLISL